MYKSMCIYIYRDKKGEIPHLFSIGLCHVLFRKRSHSQGKGGKIPLKEMSNLAVGPAMAWTTTAIGAIQNKGNVKNPKAYQTVQGHWFVYGPGRTAGGLLQNYSRNCTRFFFFGRVHALFSLPLTFLTHLFFSRVHISSMSSCIHWQL